MSFPSVHFAQRFSCMRYGYTQFNDFIEWTRCETFVSALGCLSRFFWRISIYLDGNERGSREIKWSAKIGERLLLFLLTFWVFGLEPKFQRNRYFIKIAQRWSVRWTHAIQLHWNVVATSSALSSFLSFAFRFYFKSNYNGPIIHSPFVSPSAENKFGC